MDPEPLRHGLLDLFYLPPRSPELNDIERVWRAAKYGDYPQRTQTSIDAIGEAVDRAMTRQRDRMWGSTWPVRARVHGSHPRTRYRQPTDSAVRRATPGCL
ncbi:hypothetical protein QFZ68_007317 [Streptomyces sp. V1I6]|nr:hypothetical protein [Streptomyces sp. V1I6]